MSVRLLLFYVLATSAVRLGRTPTCDRAHPWQFYSAASLGHQAIGPMTCYPTQSHYLSTESTSPYHILIMLSARLGNQQVSILKSLV